MKREKSFTKISLVGLLDSKLTSQNTFYACNPTAFAAEGQVFCTCLCSGKARATNENVQLTAIHTPICLSLHWRELCPQVPRRFSPYHAYGLSVHNRSFNAYVAEDKLWGLVLQTVMQMAACLYCCLPAILWQSYALEPMYKKLSNLFVCLFLIWGAVVASFIAYGVYLQ